MLLISIPAVLTADRVPRRLSMLSGGFLLSTSMLTIGTLYALDIVKPTGAARWAVIVLVFVFSLTFVSTWGLVGKIYASEIQPAATRSSASCVAQGLGFFTNWLVAISTPVLLAKSAFSAYFIFGSICLATVVVLGVTMPETRGLSLEDIQERFRRPVGPGGRFASWLRRMLRAQSRPSSLPSGVERMSVGAIEMTGNSPKGEDSANASSVEAGPGKSHVDIH